MASEVKLTFAGDSAQLERAFDRVGQSSKGMADNVDKSSKDMEASFDRAGGSIDDVGDKGGDLESGLRGTTDVMTGFGAVAKGDVLGGLTDMAGGVEALAAGFSGVLVPALQKSWTWLGTTKVGILAHAAASKAAALGSKIWAAGQWLLNAALTANPIGLIIVAVIALIAIIVLIATKTTWFQTIWKAIWGGILAYFNFVKNAYVGVFNFLIRVAQNYFAFIGRIRGVVVAAFSGLAGAISAPFRVGFEAIRSAWNSIIGGKGFTVPSWVPGVGGKSFRIPRMHTGGIVGGAPGTESLAILQAGERVTPAGQSTGADARPLVISGDALIEALIRLLAKEVRKQGGQLAVLGLRA